jgi:hypothetical protein
MIKHQDTLNDLQLNLLNSLSYIKSKERIIELESLINFYLEKKLDESIEKVETENNYSATVYEAWLHESRKKNTA